MLGNSLRLEFPRDDEWQPCCLLQVLLLDARRSMNINIFLKQFKASNADIVALIKSAKHQAIGQEKLLGLLKILPQPDEVRLTSPPVLRLASSALMIE